MQTVVVLDDGETYSGIDGCKILILSEAQMDAVYAGVKIKDLQLEPFATILLSEPVDKDSRL